MLTRVKKNGGWGGEWYHLFPESGVAPPVTCDHFEVRASAVFYNFVKTEMKLGTRLAFRCGNPLLIFLESWLWDSSRELGKLYARF